MFHRVPQETDALAPSVADAHMFEEQMRWLSDYCNVVDLREGARLLRDGKLPPRAAAITFDDGYADNLHIAAPILSRLSLPATFFVATGAVESGIMWNDLVIEGIRSAPSSLHLEHLSLGRFELGSDDDRRQAIRQVIGEIKYRPFDERREIADGIHASGTGGAASPRLMMTPDEVRDLADKGFGIGDHTVSHPILARLDDHEALEEIRASRNWLEALLGEPPASFAYPNGRPGRDFTPAHSDMVSDCGFELAVSTEWGAARAASHPHALPRFAPWERDKGSYWTRLAKTLVRSYV